jgi:hypothetical protein
MTPLSFATLMTSPLKACLPDGSTGRGAKTGIYYIFAKPDDLPTAKLQDCKTARSCSPDGRAERKKTARWAVLARSQLAGMDNSAIPSNWQGSF